MRLSGQLPPVALARMDKFVALSLMCCGWYLLTVLSGRAIASLGAYGLGGQVVVTSSQPHSGCLKIFGVWENGKLGAGGPFVKPPFFPKPLRAERGRRDHLTKTCLWFDLTVSMGTAGD